MKSIWAIFIDTSGSMSGGFSAGEDFPGLIEKGAFQTKIDAAKEILLRQIKGLPSGEVAVIAFTHTFHLVYRGPSREVAKFEEPVHALQAGGGTDIGSALLFARSELGHLKDYTVTFLVISDGISEGNSEAAAQECINQIKSLRISTILIDPTPQGLATARAISIGGEVKAVTSSIKLEGAITEERESHAAAIEAAQQAQFLQIISIIGAFTGVLVAVSGLYTTLVERPNVAIPVFIAALATIGGAILFYLTFAQKEIPGIYPESKALVPRPISTPKYVPEKKRALPLIGGAVLIMVAILFVVIASAKTSQALLPEPTATPVIAPTVTASPIPTTANPP